MNKYYTIGACLVCKQGVLEILKEKKSNTIFICCDECEAEWENPENALNNVNGSRSKYSGVVEASIQEIKESNWYNYIL